MPYRIVNLISTRKDPSARGRAPLLARKPVLIGTRILHPGQTCTIGDAYYERSKARIKEYVSQGVITAQYFAQVEQAATTSPDFAGEWVPYAPRVEGNVREPTYLPEYADTDAAQLEALALAAVPVEVEVEVEVATAEEPAAEPQEAVVEEEKPVEKVEEKKPSKADDLDALLAAPPKRNKKG